MANEIAYKDPYGTEGLTLYANRINASWMFWNGTSDVAFNVNNWSTYAISLADKGGGWYVADMPTGPAGIYSFVIYEQLGSSPDKADTVLNAETPKMEWDGTAEVPLYTRLAPSDPGRTLDVASDGSIAVAGLSASGLDDIIVEPATVTTPAINLRQAVALIYDAAPGGLLTGINTANPISVYNPSGETKRMTILADPVGNRSSVVINNMP